MTKLILEIEEDYDFALIGIVAHVKDYRLSWDFNKNLGLDFIKDSSLEIKEKDNSKLFSFHYFVDDENSLEYYLIGNKGEKGVLIPEENKCDFFLVLKGNFDENRIEELSKKLSTFKSILASYQIDIDSLKSKKNLIF